MTAFIAISGALAVLALAFVLTPLLKRRDGPAADDRVQTNAALYRDQIAELDAERAQGLIDEARYNESRAEIERQLAEDLKRSSGDAPAERSAGRSGVLAGVLGVAVPVLAVGIYLVVGNPDALDPTAGAAPQAQHSVTPQEVEAMVAKLAARLEKEPDNAEGWWMLARSYRVLERFQDSAKAFARVLEIAGKHPDVLADYADVLAMAQDRQLAGEPHKRVLEALELDPNHVKALALAGTAEFEGGNYRGAIAYWERMASQLPPESELARSVQHSIAEARQRAGIAAPAGSPPVASAPAAPASSQPASAPGAERVEGTVRLDATLSARITPQDTVFVVARAIDGPPLPLAVARVTAKDLPYKFHLDDSMAMSPAAKLSDHKRITIVARVSRSGNATPVAGDLEGTSLPIAPGARGVEVVISRVRE